jgi:hypothetical protein
MFPVKISTNKSMLTFQKGCAFLISINIKETPINFNPAKTNIPPEIDASVFIENKETVNVSTTNTINVITNFFILKK